MGGWESCKVVIAMVGLQFIYAGVALFTRAAFLKGMSPRVFVVYRQAIAALTMAPIAFVSTRRNPNRAPLAFNAFFWMFLASLIGVTANQNAYFEGVYLASSTMASTMTNLIPAVTFVMAFFAGWEKVNIRRLRSVAKVIGTICCVTGAIAMVLLKGAKLLNADFVPPLKSILYSHVGDDTWFLGCMLLFGSSCFWSFWMILQVPISKSCPDHTYSSAWMCFLATIQSATFAFFAEGSSFESWSLNSWLEWGCCLYSGIGLAVSFFLQAWCISKRGPLYCAMFNPLCTVIVTIFAALFLHEQVYVGSLVGAFGVIMGLYIVLWGKAKDLEQVNNTKMENDQTKIVQVMIDDPLEKTCVVDLKQPLLTKISIDDTK